MTKPRLAKITPYVIPRPSRTGMGSRTFVMPDAVAAVGRPVLKPDAARHSLHSMCWILVQLPSSSLSGSQVSRRLRDPLLSRLSRLALPPVLLEDVDQQRAAISLWNAVSTRTQSTEKKTPSEYATTDATRQSTAAPPAARATGEARTRRPRPSAAAARAPPGSCRARAGTPAASPTCRRGARAADDAQADAAGDVAAVLDLGGAPLVALLEHVAQPAACRHRHVHLDGAADLREVRADVEPSSRSA